MRCPICGCHFSFEVIDVDNDGTLKCPCCSKYVRVRERETLALLPKVKVRLEDESTTN